MPRKAFVADLQDAISDFVKTNVSELKAGEEDGMINFNYHLADGDTTRITILVPGKCCKRGLAADLADPV